METDFKALIQQLVKISDEEFNQSAKYFEPLRLKKGEFFVEEGKVCKHIAYVHKGMLRTFYINDKAEAVTSCFCSKNKFTTSYKSLILQQPSSSSIQAMEDTDLLVIKYDDLQKLYATSEAWHKVGRLLTEQEYLVMEQYASILNNETAKQKYLRLLKEQPEVIQKSPVHFIASYLGITTRTLSRIRKES